MLTRQLLLASLLVIQVFTIQVEVTLDYIKTLIKRDTRLFERLVAGQWRASNSTYKLETSISQMTIRQNTELNGVDFIIPAALVDEDNRAELNWILTGSINSTVGYGIYPSFCLSYSNIEIVKPLDGIAEVVEELDAILEKLQDTLFSTWDVRVWEQIHPAVKAARFYYWIGMSMSGKVEVRGNDLIVLHMNPEYYFNQTKNEIPIPEAKTRKDFRIVIDPQTIDYNLKSQIQNRQPQRFRPVWTKNATDFNKVMDLITASYLKQIIPNLVKEVGESAPLDLNINAYLLNEADKKYINNGENSFTIKDNEIDLLSTFSLEIIARVADPKYGNVWKLIRGGYAKAHVGLALKQVSPTKLNLKFSGELVNAMLTNFEEKLTNEEDEISQNIQRFLKEHPEGIEVDIAPLLSLSQCLGFDKNSFEISIEDNHIVISFNRDQVDKVRECDLTRNFVAQTPQFVNDVELNNYRFGQDDFRLIGQAIAQYKKTRKLKIDILNEKRKPQTENYDEDKTEL
ncbi:UNKNOWN [Stylonychia lemnae]|uniref:Uncharacterized protein n=1 Tax=Stylonychia lemnae TaxID=5949 RepID=A0A077ZPG8_STYLE|nr:UNKNOWN [Stylonychia lemnae]|eukprot:CDW71285.1 UNKNOWN [Stylonychia lemnae]